MKPITITVSERVLAFLDAAQIEALVEDEAERLEHIRRSLPLTQKEKDLRAAIGKEAYKRLTPVERERMLACLE